MKIYLENNNIWKINPDMLHENRLSKYIRNIQQFKRVFSEESILEIKDKVIQHMSVIDKPIEYGKILHYTDHDYYQSSNEIDEESEAIEEIKIILDKSQISYEQVYRIPPKHVNEDVTEYTISLQKKSKTKMLIEVVNKLSYDMYFLVPDTINIQDICSTVINLFQLVKI